VSELKVRNGGFTLIELVVVLAVTGVLVAALAPRAFVYFQDAKKTQAQNDVNLIANAIGQFGKDTALVPYKNNNSSAKVAAKQSGDYDCLYSSSGATVTTTLDSTGSLSWTSSGGVQCQSGQSVSLRDTIENHLITNTPGGSSGNAYVITGRNAWRGPYLPSVPADPWGNSYLVNIGKGDPALATKKAVWVISAGPNGRFETSADANASTVVTAAGDDVIARVQ